MNLDILQRAIPIKTNLQNAIVNCLSQEELADIDGVDYLKITTGGASNSTNVTIPDKVTIAGVKFDIGTIIKEYEWGLYYLHKEGIQELKDRIRNGGDIIPHDLSICEELLNGNNYPKGETIKFDSSDHIRYVNGVDVSGHNYGCNRQIEIQKNIEGREGYTVTIYNLDGIHPLWGNNVQMAPKQMRIINVKDNIVSLRGYGYDRMGSPFSDYGIDAYFHDKEISKIVLKMFDRNIELEYLK